MEFRRCESARACVGNHVCVQHGKRAARRKRCCVAQAFVPKTFAKKPATMKKSNIFENEAVDFYEIPEIKGHQNHDKSTKIYDNSYQDNSNEINLPNKSENSINKIEKKIDNNRLIKN